MTPTPAPDGAPQQERKLLDQLNLIPLIFENSLFTSASIDHLTDAIKECVIRGFPLLRDLPDGELDLSAKNQAFESTLRSMSPEQLLTLCKIALEGARLERQAARDSLPNGSSSFAVLLNRILADENGIRRGQIVYWDRSDIIATIKAISSLRDSFSRLEVKFRACDTALLKEAIADLNSTKLLHVDALRVLREGGLSR